MTEYTNETLVDLIRNTSDKAERRNHLTALYQQNYQYIRKVCRKYSGYEELDDLMQESFFGLRLAVDRYDPDQGIPFINFASIHIEAVIRRYILNCGHTIRIPSDIYSKIIKYVKTDKAYMQKKGRHPTDQELEELLSLDADHLKKLKEYADILKTLSIDKSISSEDDSLTFADMIPDPRDRFEEVSEKLDDIRKHEVIWNEVEQLKPDQALVIKKYFRDSVPLSSMARSMGLSCEAVRKIKKRGLKSLRGSKKILLYADDYLSAKAFSGTGLSTFLHTGMSSTERTAIDQLEHCDQGLQQYIKETERDIRRIEKKYHITLDDGYMKMKIAQYKEAHAMTV